MNYAEKPCLTFLNWKLKVSIEIKKKGLHLHKNKIFSFLCIEFSFHNRHTKSAHLFSHICL